VSTTKTKTLKAMKKIILLLCFAPLLMASTCESDDDQIFCTQEVVDGLRVTVLDATSGQPLTEGVTVGAAEGTYQETLELLPGLENLFAGAGERSGTYTVTITKDGYQTYISPPIVVTRDVCHVITQSLTVNLQSN
jgi:hypothetical protein